MLQLLFMNGDRKSIGGVRRFVAAVAVRSAIGAALVSLAAPVFAQVPNHVKSITTTLVSSGAHKECFSLTTQQKLRYWYRADAPVEFNVQYVEDKTTQYPVKKDKSAIGSGVFVPKSMQDYCIVWTNASKRPVTLSFEYARVSN